MVLEFDSDVLMRTSYIFIICSALFLSRLSGDSVDDGLSPSPKTSGHRRHRKQKKWLSHVVFLFFLTHLLTPHIPPRQKPRPVPPQHSPRSMHLHTHDRRVLFIIYSCCSLRKEIFLMQITTVYKGMIYAQCPVETEE